MASSQLAAVSYLMSSWKTIFGASSSNSVVIHYGKPLPKYIAPLTLQIVGITGEDYPISLGPDYIQKEEYEIQCVLALWAGDNDELGRFAETQAAFQKITNGILADITLGGSVLWALPRKLDTLPDADATGRATSIMTFTIQCEARVTLS